MSTFVEVPEHRTLVTPQRVKRAEELFQEGMSVDEVAVATGLQQCVCRAIKTRMMAWTPKPKKRVNVSPKRLSKLKVRLAELEIEQEEPDPVTSDHSKCAPDDWKAKYEWLREKYAARKRAYETLRKNHVYLKRQYIDARERLEALVQVEQLAMELAKVKGGAA